MNLEGKNICVYDLEIKEEIDGKKITWGDHGLMGISVGCLFDYRSMEFKIYMDDNIEQMTQRLNEADLVSGFNIIDFDNKLLNATTTTQLRSDLKFFDLLVESRKARGVDRYAKGMRLDDHLEGTFGKTEMKSANGSQAPAMWKEKRLGELVSYVIRDVRQEMMLFEHVWNEKPVKTINASQPWLLMSPRFL